MKQGKFLEIVKLYVYECPYCGGKANIKEDLWLEHDLWKCGHKKCYKRFLTNPDCIHAEED